MGGDAFKVSHLETRKYKWNAFSTYVAGGPVNILTVFL